MQYGGAGLEAGADDLGNRGEGWVRAVEIREAPSPSQEHSHLHRRYCLAK